MIPPQNSSISSLATIAAVSSPEVDDFLTVSKRSQTDDSWAVIASDERHTIPSTPSLKSLGGCDCSSRPSRGWQHLTSIVFFTPSVSSISCNQCLHHQFPWCWQQVGWFIRVCSSVMSFPWFLMGGMFSPSILWGSIYVSNLLILLRVLGLLKGSPLTKS